MQTSPRWATRGLIPRRAAEASLTLSSRAGAWFYFVFIFFFSFSICAPRNQLGISPACLCSLEGKTRLLSVPSPAPAFVVASPLLFSLA